MIVVTACYNSDYEYEPKAQGYSPRKSVPYVVAAYDCISTLRIQTSALNDRHSHTVITRSEGPVNIEETVLLEPPAAFTTITITVIFRRFVTVRNYCYYSIYAITVVYAYED